MHITVLESSTLSNKEIAQYILHREIFTKKIENIVEANLAIDLS